MNYVLLAMNGVILAATALRYNMLPPIIPLFYSRAPQEVQLTPWWMLFILPISMNIFYLVNRRIVTLFFKENTFIIKFVHYVNIIITISFTLIFVKIVFLVT